MRIEGVLRGGGAVNVYRVETRERYKSESAFWYALCNLLRDLGYDVIKKEMVKDGHMVSERVYYVRARKQPGLMIWDEAYAVRSVSREFNNRGTVTLRMEGV
jgi:hypothetical protein